MSNLVDPWEAASDPYDYPAAMARQEKRLAELEAALRNVERATDCPSHKETDLVFIRAGLRLARDFARSALGEIP